MTTKPDEYDWVQDGYWLGQFEKMRHERDELRAEVERLLETWVTLSEENERLRAALIALLAQIDRDVGRLRQGKLSDLRIEAAALVGYEGLGERN